MLPSPDNPFMGLWTRDYIRFDDGPQETQQQVIWIQGNQQFADARSNTLTGRLTPERYHQLDWRQQFDVTLLGFAGNFSWESLTTDSAQCTWHHRLSLLPGEFADTSQCTWIDNNSFLEVGCYKDKRGTQHTFEERWRRLSQSPTQVWQLQSGQEQGMCLMADHWAIIVHHWRPADTLVFDNPQTLSAFSTTCWQHIDQIWVPKFGTEPLLGSASPWTPDRILSATGAGCWKDISP